MATKTINVNKRYSRTWNPKIEGKKKGNWIKSLLNQNLKPILEVIDEVSESDWIFWEQYYISLYKSWGFTLLNLTIGGEGSCGHKPSKETRKKKSESRLKYLSKLTREQKEELYKKISLSKTGICRTKETKQKLKESHKKRTKELQKNNISFTGQPLNLLNNTL